METQWRLVVGFSGLRWQGLDYTALPLPMAAVRQALPAELRQPLPELMGQLRVLELKAAAWRNSH